MEGLNEQQELAVKTTEGYIRVIAGPGAGKTRIITNRYIYLVNELGVANSNILCITFTNNAAHEMKKRINAEITDKDVGYICTFHSLAVRALREDIHCLNIVNNFAIIDDDDESAIFKKIYKKLRLTNRDVHYSDMKKSILKIKNDSTRYIKYLAEIEEDYFKNAITNEERFFNAYIEEQRQNAMLDYYDLICIFEYILMNFEGKRLKWQQKFQYIMCDEFNDVDERQFNILKILSEFHKNLMVVGDPDQTIYSWRGANIEYIIKFGKLFKNVQDIVITKNYRSVPSILNVANSLIVHNKMRLDKDIEATRDVNDKVVFNSFITSKKESKWIVNKIEPLIDIGEKPSQIAILYRNNKQSRILEEELILKNIKYYIHTGINFFNRKEIKDIISYLRFILYEKDIDFERIINVPSRGFGFKSMEIVKNYAQNNKCSLYDALKKCIKSRSIKNAKVEKFIQIIERLQEESKKMSIIYIVNLLMALTDYQHELQANNEQERIENLEELKHSIVEYENSDYEEKSLEEYIDRIALFTNNDKIPKEDAIQLMTIHASKGLEFENVFICGLNEGILPSSKVLSEEKLEEERRIFYVAVTRAKDRLFLSEIQKCYSFDDEDIRHIAKDAETSRFMFEIDKNELLFENKCSRDRLNNKSPKLKRCANVQLLLNKGDKINHNIFGNGIIQNVNLENNSYSIKFDKFDTLREISAYIKLEKIV